MSDSTGNAIRRIARDIASDPEVQRACGVYDDEWEGFVPVLTRELGEVLEAAVKVAPAFSEYHTDEGGGGYDELLYAVNGLRASLKKMMREK